MGVDWSSGGATVGQATGESKLQLGVEFLYIERISKAGRVQRGGISLCSITKNDSRSKCGTIVAPITA